MNTNNTPTFNYENLRKELLDYYGSATEFFPVAWGDVIEVERASNDELLKMAKEAGIDISRLENE